MKQTLFECETSLFSLSIKGDIEGRTEKYLSRIKKQRDDSEALVAYRVSEPVERLAINGENVPLDESGCCRALPVFFETNYFIRVKTKGASVRQVWIKHTLAEVSDAFDFDDGLLSGQVNFVNTPGKFKFVLCFETTTGIKEFALEFFVASVKMDVQSDYQHILERINKDHENLVFSFLSKTLGGAKYVHAESEVAKNTTYQIFDGVFDYYKSACEKVIHQPHLKYVRRTYYQKVDRIRRWTPALVDAFYALPKERRVVDYFRTEKVDSEVDSPENRFVLHTLRELVRLLVSVQKNLIDKPAISKTFQEHVTSQIHALEKLAAHPFFKRIGRFRGFRQESLVLQKRQGYARIYAIWLLLKKALQPNGFDVDVGYRPISALYEFWCFLKMRDILEERFSRPSESKVDGELADLWNDLEESSQSLTAIKYVFQDGQNSREIELSYQKNYGTNETKENFAYLNAQRPDIVLSIKDSQGTTFTYLFDAKYRVEDREAKDASPRGAIDDMHRYRDAIMYRVQKEGSLKHEIIGAYVLYPGQAEKAFDYSHCIAEENIGAIPLLPSNSAELESFLKRILDKQGTHEHLRDAIAPRGTSLRLFDVTDTSIFLRDQPVRGVQNCAVTTRVYPAPVSRVKNPEMIQWILLSISNQPIRILRVVKYLGRKTRADFLNQYYPFRRDKVNLKEEDHHVWQIVEEK